MEVFMDKPISVVRMELKQATVENINRSGLPLFLVVGLMEEILRELKPLAKQQMEEEIEQWRQQQTIKQEVAQQQESEE